MLVFLDGIRLMFFDSIKKFISEAEKEDTHSKH